MEASKIGENAGRKKIGGGDAGMESEEVLKKIIASHPLFEALIESHINCLKVGLEEAGESDKLTNDAWKLVSSEIKATTSSNPSELDQFMNAYCLALNKLKEAIEEPTKETKAFINATYHELKELSEPNSPQQPSITSKNLDDALSR